MEIMAMTIATMMACFEPERHARRTFFIITCNMFTCCIPWHFPGSAAGWPPSTHPRSWGTSHSPKGGGEGRGGQKSVTRGHGGMGR